jgi:hypothetical protein
MSSSNDSGKAVGVKMKTVRGASLVLWLDYVPPSLNAILSAPLRARFGMKAKARAAWCDAVLPDDVETNYRLLRLRSLLSSDGSGTTIT